MLRTGQPFRVGTICPVCFIFGLCGTDMYPDRVVRVVVTRYKTGMVLPAFLSCLASLANLHTLHLFHVHSQMTTALKNAFEGTTLTTVRSIILPGYAHEVLRSCPYVTYIKCVCSKGNKLTTVIRKSCPDVEVIEGFHPDLAIMRRLSLIPIIKLR